MKAEVYVFSREENLDLIMDTFCDCFSIERMDGNNHLQLENNVQTVDIYAFLNNMGEEYEQLVTQQKNMVSGHFAQVQLCIRNHY